MWKAKRQCRFQRMIVTWKNPFGCRSWSPLLFWTFLIMYLTVCLAFGLSAQLLCYLFSGQNLIYFRNLLMFIAWPFSLSSRSSISYFTAYSWHSYSNYCVSLFFIRLIICLFLSMYFLARWFRYSMIRLNYTRMACRSSLLSWSVKWLRLAFSLWSIF